MLSGELMPSSGLTNSYSTVAVIPETGVSGRVVNSNTGLYICPALKKAKGTGITMVLVAIGADPLCAVAVKRGASFFPLSDFVTIDKSSNAVSVLLLAGDILTNVGDSGATNMTTDMNATIQEITA